MKFKKILSAFGLIAFMTAGEALAVEGAQIIPNVVMIKVPAADGQLPTEETWQTAYQVEFAMLNLAALPIDQNGQIRGDELAKACAAQQASITPITLGSRGTFEDNVPVPVKTLFQNYTSESSQQSYATDIAARPFWYSYHSYRPNYGIYGYGRHPFYGYYGAQVTYPHFGIYYNGSTYPYYSGGNPYWYGGHYYYPYYRRW